MSVKEEALKYHKFPQPGKISINSTKSCNTQEDLSLAYTPGVAEPCLEINKDLSKSWEYTARGNQVAVVSDGTAVLGLGNIGPEAAMPVMEGKSVLFKEFADVDAIPLCIKGVFDENGKTIPQKVIDFVKMLEPTFGGINLEDIGAPACFEIEKTLKEEMGIPVFHDDQHGTAIISLAGVLNALKVVNKKIEDCKFVLNGAGAAGIACAEFYIYAGAKRENFLMCDSKGVIHDGRTDLSETKKAFAISTTARTLEEALEGADIFIGVSVGNILTQEMIKKMADAPIIFAMANPTPEILPNLAWEAGAAVVGTGRTDFPNQVNNVLGFPAIFRGALDVKATDINDEMKLAAARALADLLQEEVPNNVKSILKEAYPEDFDKGLFDGPVPLKAEFVIPKPFDPRVVPRVAKYVAKAAMESGVATTTIDDLDQYEKEIMEKISK
jgi:malate dehydrogenase (oxaloacetate-decarboxylating)(NADP+)